MQNQSTVLIYIDDEVKPVGEYKVPINFELDTTKLIDGEHTLKIVSKGTLGKEGIRKIPLKPSEMVQIKTFLRKTDFLDIKNTFL